LCNGIYFLRVESEIRRVRRHAAATHTTPAGRGGVSRARPLVGRSDSGVEFVGNLATDAGWAAGRGAEVVAGASLDSVLVPEVTAHDQQRDAGGDAGQEDVEDATLAHTLGVLVSLAWEAKVSTQTVCAVSTHAVAGSILELFSSAAVSAASLALTFAPAFAFTHDDGKLSCLV